MNIVREHSQKTGKHKIEAVETPEEILNKPPPSKLSSAVQNVRDFFVKSEAAEAISDVIHPDAKRKEHVRLIFEPRFSMCV